MEVFRSVHGDARVPPRASRGLSRAIDGSAFWRLALYNHQLFDFGAIFVMHREHNTPPSADGLRLAVIVSRYHDDVTGAMRRAATELFIDAGGAPEDLHVYEAPGTFELPVLCSAVCRSGVDGQPVDGIVALGCVITGETTHDQYINTAVSNALAQLSVEANMPIAFGILTCQTMEQAVARAGGAKGNKGAEAMQAVLETVRTMQSIRAVKERT